ncbi:MAG: TetR family transcriptional regulator [Sneathiellales bacterium]|nr:TetR family transcriptional regulator [Sneathiellales bacterium]
MSTARKRAPSARSLETKAKILDAAELVFAERGFEGAALRDIATLAAVPVGLVHHHGRSKEELFCQTVRRRATEMAQIRMESLARLKESGDLTLYAILDCFMRAYITLAETEGAPWRAYGRLVAHVSSDPRWKGLTEECFDPTASAYLDEILTLYPDAERAAAAAGQVYSVSSMLAHRNSGWRIDALGEGHQETELERLVTFCAAGFEAILNGS